MSHVPRATMLLSVVLGLWTLWRTPAATLDEQERAVAEAVGPAEPKREGDAPAEPKRGSGPPAVTVPLPQPGAPLASLRDRPLFTWQANVELEPMRAVVMTLPPGPERRVLPDAAAEWVEPRALTPRRIAPDRRPVNYGPPPSDPTDDWNPGAE